MTQEEAGRYAISLWKRYFEKIGEPWESNNLCHFCSEQLSYHEDGLLYYEDGLLYHEVDCIWLEAKKLLDEIGYGK